MIPAIVGFMPLLDRRLNILNKSGTAAKVVPKPATIPSISDRLKVGASRLAGFSITNPSQPHIMVTLSNPIQRIILSTRILSNLVIASRTKVLLALGRLVSGCARLKGPGFCILRSIKHTSRPRWFLPSFSGMLRALGVPGPARADLITPSDRLGALLERSLFTPLQEPLGVQEPVKLDKFGHKPGPAGLVAGA